MNVFANLLPGVGSFRWTNGKTPPGGYTISTWQDYVECFEGVTDFDYLMFDMYPFAGGEGVIEGVFIEYASRLATIAKNTGKMWMGCVQVGGGDVAYSGKRVCNENEMNWDVNVLLAMGAKGLNYYTLVSAPYLGGTVESIHEITAEILYDCYNTFYNLNNMVLIVCGNVTLEGVA